MSIMAKVETSNNSFLKRIKAITGNKMGVFLALIILLVVSSIISDRFLSVQNMLNVLRQISIIGILAVGQTYVILTGGIDLSVGSILAMTVVLIAGLIGQIGLVLALIVGVVVAIIIGAINGLGVSYGKLPAFIMTLGMLSFARGIAFIYTKGTPIPILNETFYYLGNGYFLGLPVPAIIFLGVLVTLGFVLMKTPYGRSVYAIGSNEEAARLSGVPVKKYMMLVYMISGLCAGIAGILYASQLGVGTPIAGQGYELDAIASVVVGGTALTGGEGSVVGTFIGILIIGVLANILNLAGVNPFVQRLFKGALIVGAVLIMNRSNNRR